MRINVDGYALRDPRVLRLARKLGLHRHQVLGQLLEVWAVCYDRVTDTISALDIDTAAEMDGFAVAMCDPQIELAQLTRNGLVRICGAARRITYLQGQSVRGKEGGKKSGETRRSKRTLPEVEANPKRTLPEPPSESKPSGSFSFSGSGSGSGSVSGSTPTPEREELSAKPTPRRPAPKVPGYSETIAAFDAAYRLAYSCKPTWGEGSGRNLKRLLAAHGAPEVQRRIAVLFHAPPSFLAPPYDFGTFVQHFDKLALEAKANGRTHGSAAAFDLVREAEARERTQRGEPS